jgi:general secretion pathway protein K
VEVSFEDESGKIPLIHANVTTLMNLFQSQAWGPMLQPDAQHLADVILSWMQKNYIPSTAFPPDYGQAALPYDPPQRPMRSFSELACIDYAREVFYDKNGRPNDLFWRFCNDFSLFNYAKPDINGANADVLTAVGQFDETQQQNLSDYLNGTGQYAAMGKQWFQSGGPQGGRGGAGNANNNAVRGVVGAAGNPNAFGTSILALRILVTVHEGSSQFRLSTVVSLANQNGAASTVQTTATDVRAGEANAAGGQGNSGANVAGKPQSPGMPTAAQASAAQGSKSNIKYPFTILEILEDDRIPTPPPPPPAPPAET